MTIAEASSERPTVKVTYLERQKKKEEEANTAEANVSDTESTTEQDMQKSTEKEAGEEVSSKTKPTESKTPKKMEFRVPGPSPSLTRRDIQAIEKAKQSPASAPKGPLSRSSSSLSRTPQRAAATTPSSSSKKPSSRAMRPPTSVREPTPESDGDDNASVAESNVSVPGVVRRTEAERIQYFENEEEASELEPHRVFCKRCQTHVSLGRKRNYTVRPWEVHRSKCDLKPRRLPVDADVATGGAPGPADLVDSDDAASVAALSVAQSEASGRKTEEERKAILEADPRAEVVRSDEVKCRKCRKWIRISKQKTKYSLTNWKRHQLSCSVGDTAVPSNRVASAERKLRIVNDSQAKSFGPRNIECALCGTDVALEGQEEYELANWDQHKLECLSTTPNGAGLTTNSITFPSGTARPPPSIASTENTLIASDASPSRMKRPREEPDLPADDPDTRPQNRPRSDTYEAPQAEAPSSMGWFLLPFKAFVRGFRESLKGEPSA